MSNTSTCLGNSSSKQQNHRRSTVYTSWVYTEIIQIYI